MNNSVLGWMWFESRNIKPKHYRLYQQLCLFRDVFLGVWKHKYWYYLSFVMPRLDNKIP